MGKPRKGKRKGNQRHRSSPRRTQLRVRQATGFGPHAWQLVHPRCARERAEDLEEVHRMLEAGETEIARDELRWLLDGCTDCVEAHQLLGQLSYDQGDPRLARGHFGYAYDIVMAALPHNASRRALPYAIGENRAFYSAALGLALCLWQLEKPSKARRVLRTLLDLDASDPMDAAALLQQWDTPSDPSGNACPSGR